MNAGRRNGRVRASNLCVQLLTKHPRAHSLLMLPRWGHECTENGHFFSPNYAILRFCARERENAARRLRPHFVLLKVHCALRSPETHRASGRACGRRTGEAWGGRCSCTPSPCRPSRAQGSRLPCPAGRLRPTSAACTNNTEVHFQRGSPTNAPDTRSTKTTQENLLNLFPPGSRPEYKQKVLAKDMRLNHSPGHHLTPGQLHAFCAAGVFPPWRYNSGSPPPAEVLHPALKTNQSSSKRC